MPTEIPHFAYPFNRGENGKVAVVEQDEPEHVMSCVNVIVRCPLGFRVDRPEFGWEFPQFRNTVDGRAVVDAIRRFEPRAVELHAREIVNAADAATREVEVEVGS